MSENNKKGGPSGIIELIHIIGSLAVPAWAIFDISVYFKEHPGETIMSVLFNR